MFDRPNYGKIAVILAIIIVLISYFFKGNDDTKPVELIYNGKTVIITKHAEERMDCREISMKDVAEVIKTGKENRKKSEINPPNCPKIALEGSTKKKASIRIIVADCKEVAKLVTVIDLKNNYNCEAN